MGLEPKIELVTAADFDLDEAMAAAESLIAYPPHFYAAIQSGAWSDWTFQNKAYVNAETLEITTAELIVDVRGGQWEMHRGNLSAYEDDPMVLDLEYDDTPENVDALAKALIDGAVFCVNRERELNASLDD